MKMFFRFERVYLFLHGMDTSDPMARAHGMATIMRYICILCKSPDIPQPAIVSSDSSEDSSPRAITDQKEVEQGVAVRPGPLRPSDLKRLAIEHHGFARAKVA